MTSQTKYFEHAMIIKLLLTKINFHRILFEVLNIVFIVIKQVMLA